MVIEHSTRDKLDIDFTGKKLSYVGRETGEIFDCEVYVSVLGNSSYTYVEAVGSQSQEDYVSCTNNSLQYFGGVPRVLVPDSLNLSFDRLFLNKLGMRSLKVPEIGGHYGEYWRPASPECAADKRKQVSFASHILTKSKF